MAKPKRAARPKPAHEARADAAAPEDEPETTEIPVPEDPAERRRRRARFLRELAEARELRERVHPRRTKAMRLRQAARMRTFRF
ncbi:hypothetical protein [Streptacidiphilus rugosus]|uniref:hypothetical protein n=1 Tax=Streptacidiphilus rugosus TaxID=405783 RepID=UPI0005615CFB|nr:hypothetical protein [Streptacidiphilus rugosus]